MATDAADGLPDDDARLVALAAALGQALLARNWKVSVAESCTGGGVAFVLTSVAGSSQWFEEGFVTYANHAKERRLQVPAVVLAREGAVSTAVVEAMARGAAAVSGAACALAISGIAGPGGAVPGKPVGTVCLGWAVGARVDAEMRHFKGNRAAVRRQAIACGLQGLLQRISM